MCMYIHPHIVSLWILVILIEIEVICVIYFPLYIIGGLILIPSYGFPARGLHLGGLLKFLWWY